MPTVVDDATLLAVLSGQAAPALASAGPGEIVTTGAWYYRPHRALHDQSSVGALSRIAAKLPRGARDTLRLVLDELPPEIVVPGPRLLVPVMGPPAEQAGHLLAGRGAGSCDRLPRWHPGNDGMSASSRRLR
ncbi:MAG: hypothetical protein ACYCSF_12085 [Acidimicrobiales bacterium]